jgi:hypothetical protein
MKIVSPVSTPSHSSPVFTQAAQRVAPVTPAQQPSATMSARVFAHGAPQSQQLSRVVSSKGSPGARQSQSVRPTGMRAPAERSNRNGVSKGATPTSRVGREGRAAAREPGIVRVVRGARSEAGLKQSRERVTANATQMLRDPRGKNAAERSAVQVARGAKQDVALRAGQEKGALGIRADGRIDVRGASVANVPVRQIAAMLAQLRALSPKELKSLRLDRFDRPADVQVALAIRTRAQRLMERLKNLPLKDIEKIKGLKLDPRDPKRAKEPSTLSPREMLARREVRLAIKDLSARLQSFLNPRSLLYRRVTTELTLADLERLVSILGGNRAVKGLRKKHKAGEVTQVVESDVSNAFLSQLASAADAAVAGGDSGGSDDSSPAQEGAGAETSTEASVEEASFVADGAVPTATLTTVIMKEETPGGIS